MKKIYFVGNAHLDPVWMWRWQEGTAEAKATIRSALDRMKEYPEFRFVCSSSIVYQWIEAFDPAMFEEIRERVREGRFVIVGGWIVQPDCNLPSGESFARHSLYGQRYFKEKFGVTSKIGYPIVVFNPHGFDVEELITVNAQVPEITDAEGNALPIQEVRSQTFSCKARSDTAFLAKVPAMGYATYYRKEAGGAPAATEDCSLRIDANSMENERLRVEFEAHTGYIRSVYDKARNMELSDGFCAVPVVIDEFEHDTWSHRLNFFDREIARFSDGELKIIEHGPLRVTMKVVNRYNDSVLTQYFSLRRGSGTLDVRATVDWHEKHKLLKLAYSTAYREADAYYEIPFGVIRRPTDGEEEPGLRWFALRKGNDGLAMLNNNKNSFSVKDNVMNLTVVRSPLYGDHGRGRDDECEFTDQGAHEFAYALMPIGGNGWSEVIREAEKRNLPMSYIMENNHNGTLPTCYRGFSCDRENVAVSALKMSEDGTGAVLRLYETDGVETRATVSGALLPKPLCAHLGAYSVNTYFCSYETGEWKEVLLTEYDA